MHGHPVAWQPPSNCLKWLNFFFCINHIHYPNFFVLLFLIVIKFISNDVLNLRVDTEPYLKLPSFSSFFIYFIFSLYIFFKVVFAQIGTQTIFNTNFYFCSHDILV